MCKPSLRFPEFNDNWIKILLSDTCDEIKRGASPRPINNPIWFDEKSNIGWVKISDIDEKYLYKVSLYFSEKGVNKSVLVSPNSLVLSILGSVGKPLITKIPICIHDGFVVFEKVNIDIEFLYYLLLFIKKRWTKFEQPGAIFSLNRKIVGNALIYIPIKKEQNKISNFLSLLDERIRIERKIINILERI